MKVKCVHQYYFYNIDYSNPDIRDMVLNAIGNCKIGQEYDVYGMIIGNPVNYYLVYTDPHIVYVNADLFEIIDHKLSNDIFFAYEYDFNQGTSYSITVGREEMMDPDLPNLDQDTVLKMLKKTGI
ncbi:MAG: hypothetical protein AB7U79_04260 [Candidatus Izemoplasmatales bacterium]